MTVTYKFLSEFLEGVEDERFRQVQKFGDRAGEERGLKLVHPSSPLVPQHAADTWKGINAHRSKDGTTSWDGILLEEVFEALAEEGSPEKLEAELVQVAAVCCAMYEDSRRRQEEKHDDSERERRAAGKARFDRILEETAEAREANAIEQAEKLHPSSDSQMEAWFEKNGFVIRSTVGVPGGTVFFFGDPSDVDYTFTVHEDGAVEQNVSVDPNGDVLRRALETPVSPYPAPQREDVRFNVQPDIEQYLDVLDESLRELARLYDRPTRRTRPTEGVSWDELVGDPILGGSGVMDAERFGMAEGAPEPTTVRETRPFGSCCPHPPIDPNALHEDPEPKPVVININHPQEPDLLALQRAINESAMRSRIARL